VASFELALIPVGTIAFLGMAAALGSGTGAVFALLARVVPAERVGSVTGVVGAAGGLGGFFPPLVMGAVFGLLGDYTGGLALLAATAVLTAYFTIIAFGRESLS
jgi:NNP family nitrate/nitrite transporter-like MFS transporter